VEHQHTLVHQVHLVAEAVAAQVQPVQLQLQVRQLAEMVAQE
tara:strand:- start:337 stop:462 length:126 start_codon:yes stop_codon:yes gene_type:complete